MWRQGVSSFFKEIQCVSTVPCRHMPLLVHFWHITSTINDSCTGKGRLSDAGGLKFESQAGRVTGQSIPSLWRDKHPAIKGLRPPEHHAGKFLPGPNKTTPSQTHNRNNISCIYIYMYSYVYIHHNDTHTVVAPNNK